MLIQISEIKVNPERREVEPGDVQELAGSISEIGLLNPIIVDRSYTLIAGMHRLEAAKLLGWTEIECTVTSLEGLQAELAEIDENVVRKGLSAVEYSDLLLRRKEIYETLHPASKATQGGGPFRGNQHREVNVKMTPTTKSFVQDTAEKLGVGKRTIERQIQTAKNLTDEAKDIIRDTGTKITKKDALKLSRLEPEQQKEAAHQLAAGEIRSVGEYCPVQTEPESAPEEERTPQPEAVRPTPCGGYYPTIRDSVADLKNPDKDRSQTPDTFLESFSAFLNRFCRTARTYAGFEYESVFPVLTREHLKRICQEIDSAHDTLNDIFHQIEGKAKHEPS